MSADNWAECPKCTQAREDKLTKLDADVASQYGKVTVDVFDELRRRAAEKRGEKVNLHTFREDYEIGIDEGEFYVDYRGGCNACGLTHSYKITQPLDVA